MWCMTVIRMYDCRRHWGSDSSMTSAMRAILESEPAPLTAAVRLGCWFEKKDDKTTNKDH